MLGEPDLQLKFVANTHKPMQAVRRALLDIGLPSQRRGQSQPTEAHIGEVVPFGATDAKHHVRARTHHTLRDTPLHARGKLGDRVT